MVVSSNNTQLYRFIFIHAPMNILESGNEGAYKNGKQNTIWVLKYIAITALLAILPLTGKTTASKTDAMKVVTHQVDMSTTEDVSDSVQKSIEMSDEQLFKAVVAKALDPISDLKKIPKGWISLIYPSSYTWNLPKTIDFFPKEIKAETLPFTIIKIGTKMFLITPDLWFKVDEMYLDDEAFYIRVIGVLGISKEISKSKAVELPTYLEKLRTQGKNGSYALSTVYEIPTWYHDTYMKLLDEFNKK